MYVLFLYVFFLWLMYWNGFSYRCSIAKAVTKDVSSSKVVCISTYTPTNVLQYEGSCISPLYGHLYIYIYTKILTHMYIYMYMSTNALCIYPQHTSMLYKHLVFNTTTVTLDGNK